VAKEEIKKDIKDIHAINIKTIENIHKLSTEAITKNSVDK